jgi:hypothetical protein
MILFWGGLGVVSGIIYLLIELESRLNDGNR